MYHMLRVRDVNLETMPYGLLRHGIEVWLDRFTEMVDELMALSSFIERPGLIVVPDTSAFVEGVYFTDLNWQKLAEIDPHGAGAARGAGPGGGGA